MIGFQYKCLYCLTITFSIIYKNDRFKSIFEYWIIFTFWLLNFWYENHIFSTIKIQLWKIKFRYIKIRLINICLKIIICIKIQLSQIFSKSLQFNINWHTNPKAEGVETRKFTKCKRFFKNWNNKLWIAVHDVETIKISIIFTRFIKKNLHQ